METSTCGCADVEVEGEHVVNCRGGAVLGKKTILKSDHFPGCHNKRLSPHIDGAPNYRQAGSLKVHGVAMPTIDGIRNVLRHIGAHNKDTQQSTVLWHNLREEPVIYINGRPFVLRDIERPFSNLEYTGINRARVEEMEFRLKEDILVEASRYGNKILVTDELPNGQMVDQWEPVIVDSIKTPVEVYSELQQEGYLVEYERVPITDEKAPEERDFDHLVERISEVSIGADIVFNCQMGRGRTTTGMVIATLVYMNRIGGTGIPRTSSIGKVFAAASDVPDSTTDSEEAIRRGEYAVIRSLIRVLEGGVECKRQVDKVIDKCDSMQNLREAIATYRNSILRQPDEIKREASLSFFVEYLERYYFLICFAVYLHTENTSAPCQISFSHWMRARPELYSILRRLLRRDPMGALGYSNYSKPSNKIPFQPSRANDMGLISAMRNGGVLGPQTVLKSDHCPGCHSPTLPERVDGAPNFRQIMGFPVYGVANPTVDGICAVIDRISSTMGGRPVLWHNMREEPVIYINGRPFVLREVERPCKNMLEYTVCLRACVRHFKDNLIILLIFQGIDRERVEGMEARLKEDILREAQRYNGAIMVIHESDAGQIFDSWEHVTTQSVQTPLEVYKGLESAGLPVKYARVPITDGKAPKSSDFDTIALNVASSPKDTALVFNCQMGRGRTTTGTVIACLLKLRIDQGRPMRMQIDEESEIAGSCSSGEEKNRSGSEGESDNGSPDGSKPNPVKRHQRPFGIDDILILRKLTRLFDNGVECRQALDAIINRCSALQNIREALLQYRKMINQQHVEPRVRKVALNRAAEYLERYVKLIAFSAYLGSEAFDGFCLQGETKVSFKTWMHQRPEIQTMKWSIRLRPGRLFTLPDEAKKSQHEDVVMEARVRARNGSVLGKGSILKMYLFPGQKEPSSLLFRGTAHVFKVDGYPIYSMATPTVESAREVLSYLGAKDEDRQKVVITDLKEEAVVYIKGTPFVLRELDQPVDTLKHVGITGPLVEHMEARMKEDILAEIAQSKGQILLHREVVNANNQSSVIGYWENSVSADDVKTPSEVFSSLKEEGFGIEYKRVPLTRERVSVASDIDAIQSCLNQGARYHLFVSHTGYGGVAYAMSISCLRLGADSNFATEHTAETHFVQSTDGSSSNLQVLDDSDAVTVGLRQGDYRDILSLIRVLVHGPKSKQEVDSIIDRCRDAGHLRDDILHYKNALEECKTDDDDRRSYLTDMGIKALRRYFYLITYRSYLYCNGTREAAFATWMEARPELGHLCDNLRL